MSFTTPRAQAVNPSPGSSALTHQTTIAVLAGDLVIVLLTNRDEFEAVSVVGSVNGAYTRAGAAVSDTNGGSTAEIWYKENASAGTDVITATFGTTSRCGMNATAWVGGAAASALDQNSGGMNASGTAHPAGAGITTTGAGLIIGVLGPSSGNTETPAPGFTPLTDNEATDGYSRSFYQYRVVASSTSTTGEVTTGSAVLSAAKLASFNEAAVGGGLQLMGQASF